MALKETKDMRAIGDLQVNLVNQDLMDLQDLLDLRVSVDLEETLDLLVNRAQLEREVIAQSHLRSLKLCYDLSTCTIWKRSSLYHCAITGSTGPPGQEGSRGPPGPPGATGDMGGTGPDGLSGMYNTVAKICFWCGEWCYKHCIHFYFRLQRIHWIHRSYWTSR